MHGLDEYDSEARWYYPAIMRTTTIDPLAEKYYSISPYAWCGGNPVKYCDLRGDSLTLVGGNFQETLMAIYNGLENGTNISMKFNNGVLDPTSIAEQAENGSDFFLQGIYEIAVNPNMVELHLAENYNFINKDGKIDNSENAGLSMVTPYDYSDDDLGKQTVAGLIAASLYTPGRTVQGNTGRTLFPNSQTGARSTNNNIQVIINSKGTNNHRTIGINHEFWHVISFLRRLPYTDGDPEFDKSLKIRELKMRRRLKYDY
jgi:hypothetical protein